VLFYDGRCVLCTFFAQAPPPFGKKIVVIKPGFDDRYGVQEVASRAGLHRPAHIVLSESQKLDQADFDQVQCVLVDEVQFLSVAHVEQLRDITDQLGIPVICYGLRTDFRSQLFKGSRRLMELADSIEEIKTTCHRCNLHRLSWQVYIYIWLQ